MHTVSQLGSRRKAPQGHCAWQNWASLDKPAGPVFIWVHGTEGTEGIRPPHTTLPSSSTTAAFRFHPNDVHTPTYLPTANVFSVSKYAHADSSGFYPKCPISLSPHPNNTIVSQKKAEKLTFSHLFPFQPSPSFEFVSFSNFHPWPFNRSYLHDSSSFAISFSNSPLNHSDCSWLNRPSLFNPRLFLRLGSWPWLTGTRSLRSYISCVRAALAVINKALPASLRANRCQNLQPFTSSSHSLFLSLQLSTSAPSCNIC